MDTLTYEIKGQVAEITIESPPANALSSTILADLNEILNELDAEKSLKAVILKGEGKFFSAGADIKEFTEFQGGKENMSFKGQAVFDRIEQFHAPFIAAIHGAALGGGLELALSCHMRFVTKKAKLGLPELGLGIIPGFGGTQRLPRYVGDAKAYEMILTAEPVSGEEAVKIGLANGAVEEEELLDHVRKVAASIAAKSKPSVEHVLRLVPNVYESTLNAGLKDEAERFEEVFRTDDAAEGVQAFIEKRKPEFRDK
ncbi:MULTISPECIES: enoyl-CoA hydratase [Salimicrobium]|uniref:Enoyl-CoA hydratase n=3 Tax=Salimicrobium TaxID=351195 RepID=K2GD27_9BACI|nr:MULTISPECIES: enoyl-CoA hydratase [Salimicrobium]AKG04173.1 enoyl-CoA hydratase [Salimicrobium jeotgali]EKE32137.1 enoyl-CoA hydratase [Salimicrobium jeotgali]MBM7695748.1 enoyl-CoA hydratase [Salimicrobium jeotgali]SDX60740.1 short chain enoyl-CoA hydratase [Salimicrobium album]SIS50182.1 enoyl-CoA hydratase [Salimicrobium salexigens]